MSLIIESRGDLKPTILSYLWEIKNFCMTCKNVGDCFKSPVFSMRYSSIKNDWYITLYPKGNNKENENYMSIFLHCLGQRISVQVTLSLLDDEYRKVFELVFERTFENDSLGYGYPKFTKQKFVIDKPNRILVDDTIMILCEIIYDANLAKPFKCLEEKSSNHYRLEEFDEFEKLLEAETSADVTVVVDNDEIKVHKNIIMNRSPVFQAMFEHNMKEQEHNIVEITDIKYLVMKETFRFMYAGKVNDIEKIAVDLLLAADKYSIKGLKVLCEKQLINDLKIANVIEYLKIADICKVDNLKSKSIEFIVHNQKDVVNQMELKQLPVEIVCEVLYAIVAGNNPDK